MVTKDPPVTYQRRIWLATDPLKPKSWQFCTISSHSYASPYRVNTHYLSGFWMVIRAYYFHKVSVHIGSCHSLSGVNGNDFDNLSLISRETRDSWEENHGLTNIQGRCNAMLKSKMKMFISQLWILLFFFPWPALLTYPAPPPSCSVTPFPKSC